MKPTIVFWYEFASTYSYLTAMRIEAVTSRAAVAVEWRPFLLGPIFGAQGWTTSPFNIYPAKGRYMIRDIGRIAEARGIAFTMPEVFPANGLSAARIAIAAQCDGRIADFTRAVFRAEFADGLNIAGGDVLKACLGACGLDADEVWARSRGDEIKAELRQNTEQAQALGLFGAPSFTTEDGELFWGDDRLEQAVGWVIGKRNSPAGAAT